MVTVRRSTIIDAPLDAVWGILRDFNGHARWHPAVARSHIEDDPGADVVGCVRDFRLADGGRIREHLLSLSDADHSFTYCILEASLPLVNYVASVRLKPVTDGDRTFWLWEGRFEPPPGRAAELSQMVGEQIYTAGFAAIRELLARGDHAKPEPPTPTPIAADRSPIRGESEKRFSIPRRTRNDPPARGEPLAGNAMIATAYGGPEVFASRTIEAQPPGTGEVRLRHTAIGVNYIDIYCRSGYFKLAEPPAVLGLEAAGVVLDAGAAVDHLAPGDRVAYACPPPGAYCEVRTLDAALVVPLPNAIDDELAAAAMLKGMSAEFLLHRVHAVQPGDTVLVHAAAGGVGSLLCQWANRLGATVIGVIGSEEKKTLARDSGCAHTAIYGRDDFVALTLEASGGRGADVIYDGVGQATFARSFEALAVRGHLISFGQASGDIGPIEIADFASKSATLSRPNFAHYTDTREAVQAITERLFPLLARGDLAVHIDRRLPLADVAEAHRLLESRQTSGSLLLIP